MNNVVYCDTQGKQKGRNVIIHTILELFSGLWLANISPIGSHEVFFWTKEGTLQFSVWARTNWVLSRGSVSPVPTDTDNLAQSLKTTNNHRGHHKTPWISSLVCNTILKFKSISAQWVKKIYSWPMISDKNSFCHRNHEISSTWKWLPYSKEIYFLISKDTFLLNLFIRWWKPFP